MTKTSQLDTKAHFISGIKDIPGGKDFFSEWKSPSNIALVKYWGKYDGQIPASPSISFTLTHCYTKTKVRLTQGSPGVVFLYNGKPEDKFSERVIAVISLWTRYFPFLEGKRLEIDTVNSFPHSAGIASSASAMSALALCICDIEQQLGGIGNTADFFRKASFIARLGSGSASRSVFPVAALWGQSGENGFGSDDYAIPLKDVHPVFTDYRDTVLIVDPAKKAVSSSRGHQLMIGHPFAGERFGQGEHHSRRMIEILKNGLIDEFIEVVEKEALTLHALMMSSDPGFVLMKGETIRIIQSIREFREQSGIAVCFTLDAGPNVHLLYPGSSADKVHSLIDNELKPYCYKGKMIHDKVGAGPEKLNMSV